MIDSQRASPAARALRWLLSTAVAALSGFAIAWGLAELCMRTFPERGGVGASRVWWFVTALVPVMVGMVVFHAVQRVLTKWRKRDPKPASQNE